MKKTIVVLSVLLCLAFAVSLPALAAGEMLVPVGRAVGIDLDAQGVLVVGFPEDEASPAQEAGIRTGDVIVALNGETVSSSQAVSAVMEHADGSPIAVRLLRGSGEASMTVTPRQKDDRYVLGVWLRDGITGVGTVTYYDPATGSFGSLGHAVTDPDTGVTVPISGGSVYDCTISDVIEGAVGEPGQLVGDFTLEQDLGSVSANSEFGVFGKLNKPLGGQPVELASPEQVHPGGAVIYSNVAGDRVEQYDVRIDRLYTGLGQKGMMITVTDPDLLRQTGGIVQGMSGSPILQDGKLVGAVTHVLIQDPTKGYGVFIDSMLDAAA